MANKHRLYVDEVGNSDMRSSADPNHRYLCLAGVALRLDDVESDLFPRFEALKRRYFDSHPDDPVILHRKELVNKQGPFSPLRDPGLERAFNRELLGLLEEVDFTVFVVIIDKSRHNQQYDRWNHDPYHYCQEILIARYVRWLSRGDAVGDVMAESRGGAEDRRLKAAFIEIVERGTDVVGIDEIANRLTSRELKIRPKTTNVAGLQLADLIAHPCLRSSLAAKLGHAGKETFGMKIARIVEEQKYDRDPHGTIDGWGREWLP